MCPFLDLVQSITLRHNDRIKRACAPLFSCFGLNHFWYYKITNFGGFAFLDNNVGWCEFFGDKKLYLQHPYLRNPQNIKEGIYLLKQQNESITELYNKGKDRFSFNNDFQVVNKIFDGIEVFGFSSIQNKEIQTSLFVNEIDLFYLFLSKFKEDNQIIFRCLEDNLINLPALIGSVYDDKPISPVIENSKRQIFLQKLGINLNYHLTLREVKIIQLLLKGYSAKNIGEKLFLSKRTIEHYIDRIKEKLCCFSKTELIQKAQELQQFGVLK